MTRIANMHKTTWKNLSALSISILAITGCASPSQVMVNDSGHKVRCASSGYGVIGVATAAVSTSSCVEDYKKMGYRPIGKSATRTTELKASIKDLKLKGFANPLFIESKGTYNMVKADSKRVLDNGDYEVTFSTIYPSDKLLTGPNGGAPFYCAYQVEAYNISKDERTMYAKSVEFFRRDGSSALSIPGSGKVYAIHDSSPIRKQLTYISEE